LTSDAAAAPDKDAEEITTMIKEVERDTSNHLISVLQAIVNEQVQSRNLSRQTGNYIVDSVKDQAAKKGWLE
jgi:hypothetical protein